MCAPATRSVRVWIAVSEARLILTCGLPGAGKTTLAQQLAADRSALRLTQDEWLIALGSNPWDAATRQKLDQRPGHRARDLAGAHQQHPAVVEPAEDLPGQLDGRAEPLKSALVLPGSAGNARLL